MTLSPGPFGRYEIRSLLGRGGMGEVWLARDPSLDRPVVLKVLAAESGGAEPRRRLLQEARAASALNHPNIVTIHESGTEEGRPYIAMELIEGKTLRERIDAGPIDPAEALVIGAQVASALAAAEGAGVVHRDLKPENVMLRADGLVKVLDFGLARRRPLEDLDGAPTLVSSSPGAVVGTLAYMSPEQARGEEVDSRTDVWALGLLLHEMLTGEAVFRRPTAADTIAAVLTAPSPSCDEPGFTPPLRALVLRALSRERSERFASCSAFAAELRSAARDAAPPGSASSGPWREIATRLQSRPLPRVRPLPVPPTPLVGRDAEAGAVAALLREPGIRLVTLSGPGGTGKTRLALAVAELMQREMAEGALFVPLGAVAEPELVTAAIAHHLGLAESAHATPLAALSEALAGREALLVLDNFEQVLGAAADVAVLVEAAPRLKVLVTSRAPLRLRVEREFFVPPLRVPDPASLPEPEVLARVPSVALFVDRARAVNPAFSVTAENAASVAQICRTLEGLPLALELAAARTKLLAPRALAARLASPLSLLTGGAADLPARQRTMRATIAWGVDLLPEAHRALFRRLAVFVNGFTLESAVVAAVPGVEVCDALGALVDNSLLRPEETGGDERRYRMLGTIREYGLELLAASGEEEAVRRRHAEHFVRLAEEAGAALEGEAQRSWLARLEAEHDNLRAALRWAYNRAEAGALLRLTASLWRFWYLHGHYGEGRGWQEEALRVSTEAAEPAWRLRALVGAGALAYLQCDYARATALLTESLELARARGDLRNLAESLQYLGSIARELGRTAESVERHRESLGIWRALDDTRGAARSLNYIGFASWLSGALDEAETSCREALSLFRSLDDVEGTAWALLSLASVARYRGDGAEAVALGRESLTLSGDAGYKEGIAWSFDILGNVARGDGHLERSGVLLARAFELHRELGDRWRMASVATGLALTAFGRGDAGRAALLLGVAGGLRDGAGTPVPAVERAEHDALVSGLARVLGARARDDRMSQGRNVPLDAVAAS